MWSITSRITWAQFCISVPCSVFWEWPWSSCENEMRSLEGTTLPVTQIMVGSMSASFLLFSPMCVTLAQTLHVKIWATLVPNSPGDISGPSNNSRKIRVAERGQTVSIPTSCSRSPPTFLSLGFLFSNSLWVILPALFEESLMCVDTVLATHQGC